MVWATPLADSGVPEQRLRQPRWPHSWLDEATDSQVTLVQGAGRALRDRPGKVARLHCVTAEGEA
ncbi:hypothetical protein BVG81_000490 [Haliangium sp. UPWRP_2]|nr:hypothetical protein BVG81_000490 [Haliangium sp. UPWRP_2]